MDVHCRMNRLFCTFFNRWIPIQSFVQEGWNDMSSFVAAQPEHMDIVTALLSDYARWLDLPQCSANIQKEIGDFPGEYGPPGGIFIIAFEDDKPAGCIAVRRWDAKSGELKRFFVRPEFRGQSFGKLLIERAMDFARETDYERMLLDVIPDRMGAAMKLYTSYGFKECSQYGESPGENAKWFELVL